MISAFHFLRPWWLVALAPASVLWLSIRRSGNSRRSWSDVISPHLLPYLVSNGSAEKSMFSPVDWIGLSWLAAIAAIAGPTWRHEPTPFADDVAALAIVVRVTPSMETADVSPTRLARGVEKIEDVLKLRRGAKASLIAYSGTAHIVMPLTADDNVIKTFAQALDPKIMPEDGDAAADAFSLAEETLAEAGGGSILWIADAIAPDQAAAVAKWRTKSATPVRLLAPLVDGEERRQIEAAARSFEVTNIHLAADDSDVIQVAREAKFAPAVGGDASTQWKDAGYCLTPFIAAALLVFFRRGWMAPTAAN